MRHSCIPSVALEPLILYAMVMLLLTAQHAAVALQHAPRALLLVLCSPAPCEPGGNAAMAALLAHMQIGLRMQHVRLESSLWKRRDGHSEAIDGTHGHASHYQMLYMLAQCKSHIA